MGAEAFLSEQIIGLSESIDDRVSALLVAGTGITLTYNDGAGTLTIAASGGGAIGGSTGSTDNRVLRADGTGGATVQGSAVTIDDSGNISGLGTVGCGAITASGNIACASLTSAGTITANNTLDFGSGTAGSGRINMTAQQYTPSNVAINMPWGTGTPGGIYGSNGLVGFASAGTSYFEVNTSGLRLASTRSIGLGGTTASPETLLFSGGSNVLEQRNGTTAQTTRTYQSFTDASNYHRWKVDFSSSTCRFGTERAGTGATGNMELWQNGGAIIGFNSGGKIFFHNRDITFGYWNGGNVSLRQASAFSGILDLVDALSHSTYLALSLGNLIVGGAPATTTTRIKNTSGTMNFRLGNDSADCNITAASAAFSGLVSVGTYTVATLPSAAANAGTMAQVTDSSVTANGSAVAGGGANRVIVFSNGSAWNVVVA